MNVTAALHSRNTCRRFLPDAVDRATVMAILEAANRTPSWANAQPWEIYVAAGEVLEGLRQACLDNYHQGVAGASDLPRPEKWPPAIAERMSRQFERRFSDLGMDREDKELRRDTAENNNRFFGAPIVVYLCMDKTLTSWSVHDLGMMAQSIMLAATERGVASAIAYNLVIYPDLIRSALDIPADLAIIIGIALGYPDASYPENAYHGERRPLDEVVRWKGI